MLYTSEEKSPTNDILNKTNEKIISEEDPTLSESTIKLIEECDLFDMGILGEIKNLLDNLGNLVNIVKNVLLDVVKGVFNLFVDIVGALKDFLKNGIANIGGFVKDSFKGVLSVICDLLNKETRCLADKYNINSNCLAYNGYEEVEGLLEKTNNFSNSANDILNKNVTAAEEASYANLLLNESSGILGESSEMVNTINEEKTLGENTINLFDKLMNFNISNPFNENSPNNESCVI